MIKEWQERAQLYTARLKVERPQFLVVPHFRTTLFLLWFVGLAGLFYGRWIVPGISSASLSLLLSSVAWLASVFILLLEDPFNRLKFMLAQLMALILLGLLFFILAITYTLLLDVNDVYNSVKIAWIGGSVLFTLAVLYSLFRTFFFPVFSRDRYPGMVSSPLLFGLLILNYVMWHWQSIARWLI